MPGPGSSDITSLAYDSREVEPGTVFFCVPGFTSDGHDLPMTPWPAVR